MAIVLLVLVALPAAAKSWRIGIGGAWGTGYMGLLSREGMPRERLLDEQLADVKLLREFDILLVGSTVPEVQSTRTAIEEYVRQGGIALVEYQLAPSQRVLPAQHFGPAKGAHVRFVSGAHAVCQGLGGGLIPNIKRPSVAIQPADGSKAVVLARYDPQGGGQSIAPSFFSGGTGLPAIVLVPVGQGHLIYAGVDIARYMTLGGEQLCPFVLNIVRHFSGGELKSRLTHRDTGPPEDDLPAVELPFAQREQPTATPEGWEALEEDTGELGEFNLKATVPAGAEAAIAIDWCGAAAQRLLSIAAESASYKVIDGEQTAKIAEVKLGRPTSDTRAILLKRRWGSLILYVDGAPVLGGADGVPWAGRVLARGLTDPLCQPVAEVRFADNFMREPGQLGPWEAVSGSWQTVSSEGEKKTGANPFSFGVKAEETALASVGEWFWEDYEASVSTRLVGRSAGLAFHYLDPGNYCLLALERGEGEAGGGRLALYRVTDGARELLVERPTPINEEQWYRLTVQASDRCIRGCVDGAPLIETLDRWRGHGSIGLYAEASRAAFDDVEVRPWRAFQPLEGQPSTRWWARSGGEWHSKTGKPGYLLTSGDAQAVAPWRGWRSLNFSSLVRVSGRGTAGAFVRYQDERNHYLVTAKPSSSEQAVVSVTRVQDGERTRLGEAKVQAKLGEWTKLAVHVYRERTTVEVDGEPAIDVVAIGPSWGGVGLYSAGRGKAEFARMAVRPNGHSEGITDPPTPPFAGVIDLHTWARPDSAWYADSGELSRFWHHGDFPEDVTVSARLYPSGTQPATAKYYLSKPEQAEAGYVLTVGADWSGRKLQLALSRAQQEMARADAPFPSAASSVEVSLSRLGAGLVVRVGGQPVLATNDPAPLTGQRRIGLQLAGTMLTPEALAVRSSRVQTYDFSAAPSDWLIGSGTWRMSSRWSCSPQWAWWAGWDDLVASAETKQRFYGDQRVDVFVGAKMMTESDSQRRREELRDIRVGICGDGRHLNAGYSFVLGDKSDSRRALLQREGRTVAVNEGFRLPVASVHNDWLHLTVTKVEGRVTLELRGQPVLTYEDPNPLPGGTVLVGTYKNGIVIPRVTIFGERREFAPT